MPAWREGVSVTIDPDEVLDYVWQWSSWLNGDTITGSTFSNEIGSLTLTSPSFTDSTATVFISGGVVGGSYKVVNQITTSGGRTAERGIMVIVVSK